MILYLKPHKSFCVPKLTAIDTPLFMTVSINPSYTRNFHPGDTDPNIPLALAGPLDAWSRQALRQSTVDKIGILFNELGAQSARMQQGGRKTWWDMGDFEEIVPGSIRYNCRAEFGAAGTLLPKECEDASYNFAKPGDTPAITPGSPLYYRSGRFSKPEHTSIQSTEPFVAQETACSRSLHPRTQSSCPGMRYEEL